MQISALAGTATCAHFQKLGVAINNFFFLFMLGYFSSGSSVAFSGFNLIPKFLEFPKNCEKKKKNVFKFVNLERNI